MLNEMTRQQEEPVSELAVRLHRELLREGEDALAASYAETLIVLEYMWNQYDSERAEKEQEDYTLIERFANRDMLGLLFEQAINKPMEDLPPRDEDKLYEKCEMIYDHFRPIADEVKESPEMKKQGIVKLSERLHSDCANEGGHIYRLISRDGSFREQK